MQGNQQNQQAGGGVVGQNANQPPAQPPPPLPPNQGPPNPADPVECPRCRSVNIKFCCTQHFGAFNDPTYFCLDCRRYWTLKATRPQPK